MLQALRLALDQTMLILFVSKPTIRILRINLAAVRGEGEVSFTCKNSQ